MPNPTLQIKYIPLSRATLWDSNPKLHDMQVLRDSITRYGFRDAPIWDETLNKGKGGIVGGNGRIKTLAYMHRVKDAVPAGILGDGDEWLVPIQVGINSKSEAEAEAFGIDHNNATLSGGPFSALDMSKLYEPDILNEMLEGLAKVDSLPITIDGDDLDLMLKGLQEDEPDFQPVGADEQGRLDQTKSKEISCICPNCGHEFIKQM